MSERNQTIYNPEIDHLYRDNLESLQPIDWPSQWHPAVDLPKPQSAQENEFNKVIDEAMSFHEPRIAYRFGLPNLPVAPYREYFLDITDRHQTAVFSSDTGSGKSSQFPLYLLEQDLMNGIEREIWVTSPRIKAARDLKGFAAKNLGHEYAHLAGYMTGNASDSEFGPDTRIIYITEQMLFKMANRGTLRPNAVIFNDEAHERGVSTILLQGIIKELLPHNPDMKLFISSATIDEEKHAKHLTDPRTNLPAPIVKLPGRTFPIEIITSDKTVHELAKEYMPDNNLIVFEPGIQRQMATRAAISDRKNGHIVHLLYGDQSPAQQTAAMNPEDRNHIVANKIAETSLTPENKDMVIDSGLSNIGIYNKGIKVLKTVHSSIATMDQRKGRVGRLKIGKYGVGVPDNATPMAMEDREPYELSPIAISSTAPYILELASADRRIEDLDILEHPSAENLVHDYKVLKRLGALAMQGGDLVITPIGEAMTNLPLDVSLARMLVEARNIDQFYEVDGNAVQIQIAASAAIRQVLGILNTYSHSDRRYLLSQRHEENLSNHHNSDVLFELDVFIKIAEKRRQLEDAGRGDIEERFEAFLHDKDILVNKYNKALRTFEELCRRESLDGTQLRRPTAIERKAIIACQITGADELFVRKSKYRYKDIRGESRQLGNKSTVDSAIARLVVGSAFDLVGMTSAGHYGRHYVVAPSAVTTQLLRTHTPNRITSQSQGIALTKDGDFIERKALYFDDELLFDVVAEAPSHSIQTREFILRAMMTGVTSSVTFRGREEVTYDSGYPNSQRAVKSWERAQDLEHRSAANLMTKKRYEKLIKKIVADSVELVPLDITDPAQLDTVIPKVYLNSLVQPTRRKHIPEIVRNAPDAIIVSSGEDTHEYISVTYRNNVAYVSVPIHLKHSIKESDLTDLYAHHSVKLRIGKGHYNEASLVLDKIKSYKESPQYLRRMERKAEMASQRSSPDGVKSATDRLKYRKRNATSKPRPIEIDRKAPISRVFKPKKQRGGPRDIKDKNLDS